MASGLHWHGDKVNVIIRTEMKKRLARVALAWTGFAARQLKRKQNRSGNTPCAPGGYPAEFTSQLAKQVAGAGWAFLSSPRLGVRVGTNLLHGRWLQTGTSAGLRPRPWMSLTNEAMIPRIRGIMGKEIV